MACNAQDILARRWCRTHWAVASLSPPGTCLTSASSRIAFDHPAGPSGCEPLPQRSVHVTVTGRFGMLGDILDELRCRTPRARSMSSLLLVNIDWLKAYHDVYCPVAAHGRCSAAAGRPSSWCGRTPRMLGSWINEQIRDDIGEMAVEDAAGEYGRVTACIGLANPAPEQEGDVTTLIGAAGEALCNATATVRARISPFSLFRRPRADVWEQATVTILKIVKSVHGDRRET
ncbi:GGDEF domain-containing protein, diguanylate cyclase (c-di-GMP synthetase) or its enzymatically inactive variants [Burkholderia sp. GAS332]|nr:GGDEF domain-containing protein, diguanylate cyclase (c-di-GMP synthetase) or its enzymatically inactive variants [Burkholderia sp. GAS332]